MQSLPLLSDLHTSMPSLGPIPDGVTLDMLSEHVISNYAPMGKRFRCWHLEESSFSNFKDAKVCVFLLLLALACPNFDYSGPHSVYRELFMSQMEMNISSDPFKPYAPRLHRLLFTEWQNF
ncbi:hypothetical protein GGI01_000177 [Coemansia sp. RSA 376]|nr:hypothetical protein GGI01_000177 [Coemansia sp. RSA 376]